MLYLVKKLFYKLKKEVLKKKRKMRSKGNIKIELTEQELDFITDLIGSSVSNFDRIKSMNDAIGKRTKQEFIDNTEWQRNLFIKLNKIKQ